VQFDSRGLTWNYLDDFALAEIERALVAIANAGGRVLRPPIAVPEQVELPLSQHTEMEVAGDAEDRANATPLGAIWLLAT